MHHLSKKQFSRAWQKIAGWSDWKQKATTIEKASEDCKEYIPLLQQEEARKNFSAETSKLDGLFQTGQGILQHMRETRLEDKEERLLQELFSAGSTYASGKDFNPVQVKGTCEWLFNDREFCSWRDTSECDLFWIYAGPGCGKSVLSRALVDDGHLQSSSSTISLSNAARVESYAATTCYFFFKDDDVRRNDLRSALCAILHQLFTNGATRALISHAVSEYSDKGSNMMRESHILWGILTRCADEWSGGTIICLLDALDECQSDDRKSLLAFLKRYYSEERQAVKLKFIITSRPYDDIWQSFQTLARRARSMHFDADERYEDISSDINLVIDDRMENFAINFEVSDRLKIAEHLKSQQSKTYLWLHLTLDIIGDSPSEYSRRVDIEALLESLPRQLSEAYDKILNRSKTPQKTAILLSILLAATRPLTLLEANYAFTMAFAESPFRKHKAIAEQCWTNDFKPIVKSLCGLFVNFYNDELSFIHLTARDFLLSSPSEDFEWKGRFADRSVLNKSICHCCISYLLLDDWTDVEKISWHNFGDKLFLAEFPFFSYAALNWLIHLESLEGATYDAFQSQVRRLTTKEEPYLRLWARHKHRSDLGSYKGWTESIDFIEKWTDLALASFLGLRDIVRDMLAEDGLDVNARTHSWGGALQVAVWCERVEIVKMLLDNGADVNFRDGYRGTALTIAAKKGNVTLVELLLNHKADAWARSKDFEDRGPLAAAAAYHRSETFRTILARSVDLDTLEGIEKAVIDENIMNGDPSCMSMLIDVLGPGMPLTQSMVEVLMDNVETANKVLGIIINRSSNDIVVTSHMFQQAANGISNLDSLHVILKAKEIYKLSLTEETLESSASICDVDTMSLLLKQYTAPGIVTDDILRSVLWNPSTQQTDLLQLLIEHESAVIQIDEFTLLDAIEMGNPGMMKLFVDSPRLKVVGTPEIIAMAIANAVSLEGSCSTEIVICLLEHTEAEVMTDVRVLHAAAQADAEFMQLVLDRLDHDFVPSETLLREATKDTDDASVMQLLVERFGEHFVLTEKFFLSLQGRFEVTEWLLKEHGARFAITDKLLWRMVSAMPDILELIAKYKHQDLKRLARTALLAAVRCPHLRLPSLEPLMDGYITPETIDEEVFLLILEMWFIDPEVKERIMARILELHGPDLVIGEKVIWRIIMLPHGASHLLNIIKVKCPQYLCVPDHLLAAAAAEGKVDVLHCLSESGSSGVGNAIQERWWQVARFQAAAAVSDIEAMQQAINRGANPNIQNTDGETALSLGVRARRARVVKFLVAQPGINVHAYDKNGHAPLHLAVVDQCMSLVRILIDAGANPDQAGNDGVTPYTYAQEHLSQNKVLLKVLRIGKEL